MNIPAYGAPAQPGQFAGPGQAQPQFGGAAPVDPYDMLEGGKRAIKFVTKDANGFDQHAPIGTSFTGLIVGDLRTMQITDFETKQPKVYGDGRPAMQIVLDLQTNDRDQDDPTDDGVRSLYVKNQMLAAFQAGLQPTRHLGRIGEGSRVTVTLVGYKPTGKGNPQKLYRIDIGPEFVPYADPAQRQVNQAVYGQPQVQAQQVGGFNPGAGLASVAPAQQGWYDPNAQPQAAQPVAQFQQPVAQFQQPVQQPVAPAAPVQQAAPVQPAPVQAAPVQQEVSPALAALNAIAGQPVAVEGGLDPAHAAQFGIDEPTTVAYNQLRSNNIDPHTAINSLAQRLAPGNESAFIAALSQAAGVAPVAAQA